ncbi:universal stress protein [Arthrobacter cheniae]|uniref:universal stress protein n=1 Tax=Arthrobacter cheniae TaxID=1258888 RepID=UPI002287156E|nr:universal stress protein [Arthrobacter cheniae]
MVAPVPAVGGIADLDRVRDELQRNLSRTHVSWSLRGLAGDPARKLSLLADRVDASMIVVGTHTPGLGRRLGELLEGSVASTSRPTNREEPHCLDWTRDRNRSGADVHDDRRAPPARDRGAAVPFHCRP